MSDVSNKILIVKGKYYSNPIYVTEARNARPTFQNVGRHAIQFRIRERTPGLDFHVDFRHDKHLISVLEALLPVVPVESVLKTSDSVAHDIHLKIVFFSHDF